MLFSVTVKLFFLHFLKFFYFTYILFLYGFFFNLTHMIWFDPNVSVCHTVLHCEIKCL